MKRFRSTHLTPLLLAFALLTSLLFSNQLAAALVGGPPAGGPAAAPKPLPGGDPTTTGTIL